MFRGYQAKGVVQEIRSSKVVIWPESIDENRSCAHACGRYGHRQLLNLRVLQAAMVLQCAFRSHQAREEVTTHPYIQLFTDPPAHTSPGPNTRRWPGKSSSATKLRRRRRWALVLQGGVGALSRTRCIQSSAHDAYCRSSKTKRRRKSRAFPAGEARKRYGNGMPGHFSVDRSRLLSS